MKCIEVEEKVSLYIDDMLENDEKRQVELHLDECQSCKELYDLLLTNVHLCQELPMIDLPEGFEEQLHQKLLEVKVEEQESDLSEEYIIPKKKHKKYKWRIYASIAAVFIVCIVSIATVNNGVMDKKEMAPVENFSMEQPQLKSMATSEAKFAVRAGDVPSNSMLQKKNNNINDNTLSQRKIIKNTFINIDVENYDEKLDLLMNMARISGGYVGNSSTRYKEQGIERKSNLKIGNITMRVPLDKYENVVSQMKKIGNVIGFETNAEDITLRYRDSFNQAQNLKVQEERLREIMKKANNVKDILEIERELNRVHGQIENVTGNLKRWDHLVELTTIDVSLNEVDTLSTKIASVDHNLWGKAKDGFVHTANRMIQFLQKLVILFVSSMPVILLIGVIIAVLVLVTKRIIRKTNKK